MSRLPSGWEIKHLQEVAEVSSGNGAPQEQKYFENGNIPFVRVQDLGRYGTNPNLRETKDYVNNIAIKEKRLKIFPKGTILFPKSGVSTLLNHRAILGVDACVVGHLAALRPKEDLVLTKWLYYYLCTVDFSEMVSTTTLPSLQLSKISRLEIPVPPIEIQHRVTSILERADNLNRKRGQANQLTNKIIQSVFLKMFGDERTWRRKWIVEPVGELCKVQSGGTPSRSAKRYWEGGQIPWVGSTVCKDSLVTKADEYITQEGLENSSAKWFEIDTVLIALVGATIGKTGLLKFRTTTNQNIAGIYPNDTKQLNTMYLFYACQQLYHKFVALGERKFRMANLSFVRNLEIAIPPADLQQRFATLAERINNTLYEKQSQSTEEINELFHSLMHRAFTGRLLA
mgnify:CR=1 FL=1